MKKPRRVSDRDGVSLTVWLASYWHNFCFQIKVDVVSSRDEVGVGNNKLKVWRLYLNVNPVPTKDY